MQKSYVSIFQSLLLEISFLVFVVSVWENTWISIFFIKFLGNIEKFSAFGLELFNITLEFNEKNLNPSVFPDGNNNDVEKSIK